MIPYADTLYGRVLQKFRRRGKMTVEAVGLDGGPGRYLDVLSAGAAIMSLLREGFVYSTGKLKKEKYYTKDAIRHRYDKSKKSMVFKARARRMRRRAK